jgi:cell wall-associated NlpC family hydrolase
LDLNPRLGEQGLTNLKNICLLSVSFAFICVGFADNMFAQDRERVTKTVSSQPVNQPPGFTPDKRISTVSSKPVNAPRAPQPLTNDIKVAEPLVKKTGESSPVNAAAAAVKAGSRYNTSTTAALRTSINSKIGIPYRYGSTGPNRYDCSGFVWAVFSESGMGYTRSSARNLWSASVPVDGDERYKFGTLVFLNRLGHIGIVADENGFYHASSSKGITYSPFKGYWEKRIVGFRRMVTGPSAHEVTATAGK